MIVVTGATGNVGRPLVKALVAAGERVTAVSRAVSETDVPAGVRHLRADVADPERLKPALDGADALFLLTSGDFTLADGDVHGVLDAARSCGVRRVVLLSSQGVGTLRHPPAYEEAVKRSGLEWTVLRPGGFASNAFRWAETVRATRTVAAPFGDVALPVIDPDDIAAVAALTLREAGHAGATYVLTGPDPVSPRQQAAAIGDAIGEPVGFVEQNEEEARTQMLAFMPEQVVQATLAILGSPSPDEQRASPDAERVLGRPPRPFAEWAARNAAAFK
ncbi:NAD(P)H-binding protein [Streptomyces sp. NBC_01381]|uniref:NAD(P)H-binding protein n=1 Tax=Streptomyces sp. NBC_01381 TaxID=2903845 RepID=UPI0022517472|nr:NAD(P)H-binding protein [Streptomyces sp. NBC_01381]MCX4673237.1 NAD(P)H-binding protein [Streptomyces sp. NBC_01381]